jgi:hypothetical protein
MRTPILALAALLSSVSAFAQCPDPDYARIRAEIGRTVSVQEAISIRAEYLSQACTLEQFARLTDLEPLSPGTRRFPEYAEALGAFTASSVHPFLHGRTYAEIRALVGANLLPKARTFDQSISLRQELLATVSRCEEAYDLMAVREDYAPRWQIERELRHRFWNEVRYYCR